MSDCTKCGKPGARPAEVYKQGIVYDIRDSCDGCWADFVAGLEEGRKQFNILLDKGLTREAANAEMTRRLEAGEWG